MYVAIMAYRGLWNLSFEYAIGGSERKTMPPQFWLKLFLYGHNMTQYEPPKEYKYKLLQI